LGKVPFWEDVLNEVKNGSPKALGKVPTEEVGECNEPTVPRLWVRSNAEEEVLNEVKNGSPEDLGKEQCRGRRFERSEKRQSRRLWARITTEEDGEVQ
jgi:hypothetical protein